MLELYSIVSGSSGNCSLITDGKVSILSDCGASGKSVLAALSKLGVDPETIKGILVTHEHSDHTKGVGVMARKLKIPVYATRGTHNAMSIGKLDDAQRIYINPDIEFEIEGIAVTPYTIPHDAADPCCFSFTDGHEKISIATDIGHMPDTLLSRLKGSKSIILESNHDINMLRYGEYPYPLKQRILSNFGHLSNVSAALVAYELIESGTEHIMLGHLSDKNNLPEIAQLETYNYLSDHGVAVGHDATLQVASRYDITKFANKEP